MSEKKTRAELRAELEAELADARAKAAELTSRVPAVVGTWGVMRTRSYVAGVEQLASALRSRDKKLRRVLVRLVTARASVEKTLQG